VTSVTPELTKPDWVGENAGEAACEDFTQPLKDMVDNAETGEIADVDKDGATDQKYAAAITYEALTGDEKTAASNAELIARSYVKITQGETETIVYAAANDTVRNMKGVAYEAIQSGKYTASEDNLYGYTGVTSADVVTNEEVNSFYSELDKNGAITVNGLNTTDCEVYYGAKKVTASVQGGVVTVSGIEGLEAGEGKEYELTVFGGDKIYNQAFGCATLVIDEAEDLDVFCLDNTDYYNLMNTYNNAVQGDYSSVGDARHYLTLPQKKVKGYYVLAKDINASEYAMKTQGYITNSYYGMGGYGFNGVFDGRGYTIDGITFGYDLHLQRYTVAEDGTKTEIGIRSYWNANDYSLFGIIGANAKIKNFALTNVSYDLTNTRDNANEVGGLYGVSCNPMAKWICSGATIENVYVEVNGIKKSTNGYAATVTLVSGFAYCVDIGASLKNVVVNAEYALSTADGYNDLSSATYASSFAYRKQAGNDSLTNSWKDVVVISSYALTIYKGNANNPGYHYDGSNVELPEKVDYTGYVNMPNTYRYESVSAWEAAQADTAVTKKPDVSTFGTDYWHLVNDVPVWGKATA
ncbi:MAG: hypothetical protein J6A63_01605, partial [Clostridia bacterium]|nr:hypothetical protein [Clostridia bacterium]